MAPVDFQIKWTEWAREDFRDILLYIAADNPEAALGVGDRIEQSLTSCSSFLNQGQSFPKNPKASTVRLCPEIIGLSIGFTMKRVL